jgi:hypothetical protein
MGYKKVCLKCRLTLNRPFDSGSKLTYPCPECGNPMTLLPYQFRPPKKTEDKKWETVIFLIENGFYYQPIYEIVENKNVVINYQNYAKYPYNHRDAKEFIEQYKGQARK